jgi:phosphohistidine phosphatase SixA
MSLLRPFALLLLLALGACLYVPPQDPPGPSYYVMRHLHTPQGATDPDLTQEGQRLARTLPAFFELDRPAAIYVSSTKRAQQTAAPLAQAIGIAPKIYDPADTPGLVARVKAEHGNVLIVGHSNTVPDIVEQLGGTRPEPIAHDQFADIWHISGYHRETMKFRLGEDRSSARTGLH